MLLSAMLVAFGSWFAAPSTVIRVDEMKTRAPIEGAEVVVDAQRLVRTDSSGIARLNDLPLGQHSLRVRKLGYAAASINFMVGQGADTLDVMLVQQSLALDTVRVTATRVAENLRDFETRRNQGLGRYITEDQLAKLGNTAFTTVITTHIPGLRVQTDDQGTDYLVSTRSSCGGPSASSFTVPLTMAGAAGQGSGSGGAARPSSSGPATGASGSGVPGSSGSSNGGNVVASIGGMVGSCNGAMCPLVIYIDGVHIPQEGNGLDLVRTWDLGGVEYYSGSSIPARYRENGSACGVLLAWSR